MKPSQSFCRLTSRSRTGPGWSSSSVDSGHEEAAPAACRRARRATPASARTARARAARTAGHGDGRARHELHEASGGELEHLLLQGLLRTEVGEEAALGQPELVGQPADGEALQSHPWPAGGRLQDAVAGGLALARSAPAAGARGAHGRVHGVENSTIVRFVKLKCLIAHGGSSAGRGRRGGRRRPRPALARRARTSGRHGRRARRRCRGRKGRLVGLAPVAAGQEPLAVAHHRHLLAGPQHEGPRVLVEAEGGHPDARRADTIVPWEPSSSQRPSRRTYTSLTR